VTREEIIRMAKEAGYLAWHIDPRAERFSALIAAAEREACAKVCEEYRDEWLKGRGRYEFMGEGADYLADFIRARGEK
jgi:hypothetical protein